MPTCTRIRDQGARGPAQALRRAVHHPPGRGRHDHRRSRPRRRERRRGAAARRRRGHRGHLAQIEEEFGPAVAAIVDGVTKLDRLRFDSKEAQQAATMRKMLVAMASDWRVLVIKLADRLHNMRTLSVMPEWKQRRTAEETLDIYAPARAPPRDPGDQVAARGPRLRDPAPEAVRRDRPDGGDPGAAARGRACRGPRASCAHASPRPGSRRRSPGARRTSGASTRRWSCGARSSTRSTTSSRSASS